MPVFERFIRGRSLPIRTASIQLFPANDELLTRTLWLKSKKHQTTVRMWSPTCKMLRNPIGTKEPALPRSGQPPKWLNFSLSFRVRTTPKPQKHTRTPLGLQLFCNKQSRQKGQRSQKHACPIVSTAWWLPSGPSCSRVLPCPRSSRGPLIRTAKSLASKMQL